MRVIAAFLLAALLTGCAGAPSSSLRATGPGVSAQDRADPLGALRRAGAPDALTPHGAEDLFGKPDVMRRDGAGAILTWKTASCALVLVFAADAAGALRLGAAETGARDQRAADPDPDVCVAEAMARKS